MLYFHQRLSGLIRFADTFFSFFWMLITDSLRESEQLQHSLNILQFNLVNLALFAWFQIRTTVASSCFKLQDEGPTLFCGKLQQWSDPLSKHQVLAGRKNSLLTGRNVRQNQAQEGAAIYCDQLGWWGERNWKRKSINRQDTHYRRHKTKFNDTLHIIKFCLLPTECDYHTLPWL